jgi:hypothetical protein
VTRGFRGELEELRLFGPMIEEGPGGAGCSLRAGCVRWYQSQDFLCFL